MTTGNTITTTLQESLEVMIASARTVREYEGRASQLVDRVTLEANTGLDWKEVSYAKLVATTVTETTVLDNPQQFADSEIKITPTMIGIHTFVTDKVAERINRKAYAQMGQLAMNAMVRKRDQDVIAVFDGASTSLCGAGTTLSSGYIDAAAVRITSNPTEPGSPPLRAVLHGYQMKDIADELKGGIGTYPIPEGPTARVFAEGFRGKIGGVEIFEDGNIGIDSNDDAKGAVFAKYAIVLVQGTSLKTKTREEPAIGGGGMSRWIYDEFGLGERSPGNWLYEIMSDATAPTA
jgi:hypothetical protein